MDGPAFDPRQIDALAKVFADAALEQLLAEAETQQLTAKPETEAAA